MATYVSRPAWELRVRSLATARVAVPAGPRAARRAQPGGCARAELGVGYWVDEGLSVGIADRPLTDIPGVLRQDGSPPLYYVLLHIWMALGGQRRAGDAHAVAAVRAGRRPGRVLGRRARVRPPRRLVRRGAGRAQPVHLAVRAGDADVLARRAAGLLATSLFLRAYTGDERPARRWPVLFGLALAVALYTHNWALFFGARDVRRVARAALPGARRRAPARGCATARSASA